MVICKGCNKTFERLDNGEYGGVCLANTCNECIDLLSSILTELDKKYFNGKNKISIIRFMKRKSIKKFGRCDLKRKIIEINPILLSNHRVLQFVVYHELCHANMIFRKKRHKWHNRRFKEIMMRYENYLDEYTQVILFIKDYWLGVGYLTNKEIEVWCRT